MLGQAQFLFTLVASIEALCWKHLLLAFKKSGELRA
jgi:hypothetical protein